MTPSRTKRIRYWTYPLKTQLFRSRNFSIFYQWKWWQIFAVHREWWTEGFGDGRHRWENMRQQRKQWKKKRRRRDIFFSSSSSFPRQNESKKKKRSGDTSSSLPEEGTGCCESCMLYTAPAANEVANDFEQRISLFLFQSSIFCIQPMPIHYTHTHTWTWYT